VCERQKSDPLGVRNLFWQIGGHDDVSQQSFPQLGGIGDVPSTVRPTESCTPTPEIISSKTDLSYASVHYKITRYDTAGRAVVILNVRSKAGMQNPA